MKERTTLKPARPQTGRHAVARVLLALFLACAVLLGPVSAARADGYLVDSQPTAGSEANPGPAEVQLSFADIPVQASVYVSVKDAKGREWAPSQPILNGSVVRQVLKPNAPAGSYTVSWSAVSSTTGMQQSGSYSYKVTTGQGVGGQVQESGVPAPAPSTGAEDKAVEAAGERQSQQISTVVVVLIGLGVVAALAVGLGARRKLIQADQGEPAGSHSVRRPDER